METILSAVGDLPDSHSDNISLQNPDEVDKGSSSSSPDALNVDQYSNFGDQVAEVQYTQASTPQLFFSPPQGSPIFSFQNQDTQLETQQIDLSPTFSTEPPLYTLPQASSNHDYLFSQDVYPNHEFICPQNLNALQPPPWATDNYPWYSGIQHVAQASSNVFLDSLL